MFNLVDITAEYYHRKNFDLIGFVRVPPSIGYKNKQMNFATMKNEGLEFSINTHPLSITHDLSWKGTFNIGYNKNRIISSYIGDDPLVLTATRYEGYPFTGKPLTGLWSFRFAGLDSGRLAKYFDANGNTIYGFNREGKDYSVLSYEGSRDSIYSGGFNSQIKYKNFSLSTAFVFNTGHVVRKPYHYLNNSLSSLFLDDLNVRGGWRDRWQVPGDEQYTDIPRLLDSGDENFYVLGKGNTNGIENALMAYNRSDIRTINASFLRLKMSLYPIIFLLLLSNL